MYGCLYYNSLGSGSEQGRPEGPILRVLQKMLMSKVQGNWRLSCSRRLFCCDVKSVTKKSLGRLTFWHWKFPTGENPSFSLVKKKPRLQTYDRISFNKNEFLWFDLAQVYLGLNIFNLSWKCRWHSSLGVDNWLFCGGCSSHVLW